MGWTIFVVVLLIVLSSLGRNASRARARGQQQPTLLPGQRAMQAAQQFQSPQPMRMPGNAPTYQPGDSATYAPGNPATYRPGDAATYRPGDSATFAPGDSATYGPGNSVTYRPGNAPVYAPGESPTYTPVAPVGSRPAVTPPPPQAAPPQQPGSRRDDDGDYQPAYATRTERATARRDQAVIDRDARRASRTAPEQAPYQGSTAISSTSLNTTLATPYQPTSLISSLSSSLSSSLTDSPPKMASTSVFGEVAVISLPGDVVERVRFHLRNGHEVEAVRLVCDTMNVGLLEATKTVRSYA